MIWGILWHSENKLNGVTEHLIHKDCFPCLFHTRREARDSIQSNFGYIKNRPDLRLEPHGWRMPRPVKVKIVPVDTQ